MCEEKQEPTKKEKKKQSKAIGSATKSVETLLMESEKVVRKACLLVNPEATEEEVEASFLVLRMDNLSQFYNVCNAYLFQAQAIHKAKEKGIIIG